MSLKSFIRAYRSIRAVYVLFDKDGSVYKISKREISIVLNLNILNGIDDFAINSKGNFHFESTDSKKVFKVINENELITIAGLDRSDKSKKSIHETKNSFAGKSLEPALMSGFPAEKTPFGNPVSIDIDLNDNLYIADSEYGTIRKD